MTNLESESDDIQDQRNLKQLTQWDSIAELPERLNSGKIDKTIGGSSLERAED